MCDACHTELYVPGLEDENEERIEAIYRSKKQLITIPEIKSLLAKYNIEKRPMSKLSGLGELTLTRYLDGQLPSKKYSDLLYGLLRDEQKMEELALRNGELVFEVTLNKVLRAIEQCEAEKRIDNTAERIALYIIQSGKEITNLYLQKILYYVKGIGALFTGEEIIPESCEAWRYGPVFPTVYEKYKEFGKEEITLTLSEEYVKGLLTEEEKEVADYVLGTFGIYSEWFLKKLTHLEKPWVVATNGLREDDACRNTMDDDVIRNFFQQADERYQLRIADGIVRYVNDMKKRMSSV